MKKAILLIAVFCLAGFSMAAAASHSLEIKEIRKQAGEEKRTIKEKAKEAERAIKEKTREEIDALRKKTGEDKEALKERTKEKIAGIKDEQRRKRAEELYDKLANHNKNRTEKLARLLERIKSRLAELEKHPKINQAQVQLAAAKTAVSEAETAVNNQAGKGYGLEFPNEGKLKPAFATAKQLLQNDIKAVRTLVKAAHEAVVQFKRALRPES